MPLIVYGSTGFLFPSPPPENGGVEKGGLGEAWGGGEGEYSHPKLRSISKAIRGGWWVPPLRSLFLVAGASLRVDPCWPLSAGALSSAWCLGWAKRWSRGRALATCSFKRQKPAGRVLLEQPPHSSVRGSAGQPKGPFRRWRRDALKPTRWSGLAHERRRLDGSLNPPRFSLGSACSGHWSCPNLHGHWDQI